MSTLLLAENINEQGGGSERGALAMVVSERRRGRRWQVCLASSILFLAGCSRIKQIYIHSDTLEKQTDTALKTYKDADIVGAMKSALAAQAQIDKAELQSVADKESADRDRAVANLISPYQKPGDYAINRLNSRVDDRITELVGKDFNPQKFLQIYESNASGATLVKQEQGQLITYQRSYITAGGTNFTSCDSLITRMKAEGFEPGSEDGSKASLAWLIGDRSSLTSDATLLNIAKRLSNQCTRINRVKEQVQPPYINYVLGTTGEINNVHEQLDAIKKLIDNKTTAKNDALNKLQAALKADKNAATATEVKNKCKYVDDKLNNVQPGALLAAIQFRKANANLSDISTASSTKSAGCSTEGSPAVLSVKRAFQDGLEKIAQADFEGLKQKQSLLQDEQDSLLRELNFLAVARVAGQEAKSCKPLGFANMLSDAHCTSAGRSPAARALVAYNLSWASGRTAAQLDDRRYTQQITFGRLRHAQEVAITWMNIQTIALTEVDAFGQGGIKPETIAAFFQAAGVAAIAKGVY